MEIPTPQMRLALIHAGCERVAFRPHLPDASNQATAATPCFFLCAWHSPATLGHLGDTEVWWLGELYLHAM